MTKSYKTRVTKRLEAYIEPEDVAAIIEEEIADLLGGNDRYINSDGRIMESDYRYDSDDYIRDATPDEHVLYKSLRIAEGHFRKGGARRYD